MPHCDPFYDAAKPASSRLICLQFLQVYSDHFHDVLDVGIKLRYRPWVNKPNLVAVCVRPRDVSEMNSGDRDEWSPVVQLVNGVYRRTAPLSSAEPHTAIALLPWQCRYSRALRLCISIRLRVCLSTRTKPLPPPQQQPWTSSSQIVDLVIDSSAHDSAAIESYLIDIH